MLNGTLPSHEPLEPPLPRLHCHCHVPWRAPAPCPWWPCAPAVWRVGEWRAV